jgi:hypothetical protein
MAFDMLAGRGEPLGIGEWPIAQPQVVAGFGTGWPSRREDDRRDDDGASGGPGGGGDHRG